MQIRGRSPLHSPHLTAKGETFEELAGMASVMRAAGHTGQGARRKRRSISPVQVRPPAKTFNVSTAAAFVAAGAGLTRCKTEQSRRDKPIGQRRCARRTRRQVVSDPAIAQASLNGIGLCFLFAPKFHPALRRVGDIRSSLGIRTCLNVLGLAGKSGNGLASARRRLAPLRWSSRSQRLSRR